MCKCWRKPSRTEVLNGQDTSTVKNKQKSGKGVSWIIFPCQGTQTIFILSFMRPCPFYFTLWKVATLALKPCTMWPKPQEELPPKRFCYSCFLCPCLSGITELFCLCWGWAVGGDLVYNFLCINDLLGLFQDKSVRTTTPELLVQRLRLLSGGWLWQILTPDGHTSASRKRPL